ncbi:MAG: endopeptidase La [Clostridia bacterium]|nr:endopeptidase La [Clostridia bacterium]
MSQYTEKLDRLSLPVLALRGLVVFPEIDTSFEVAREMTVRAVESALAADGLVFLLTQKDASVEKPEPRDLNRVGVISRIKQSIKLPDNSYRIITEGLGRGEVLQIFRLENGSLGADLVQKEIRLTDGVTADAYRRSLLHSVEELSVFLPKFSPEMTGALQTIEDPAFLADYIAANILRRTEDKQEILSLFDPCERVLRLKELLEREKSVAKLESSLARKVQGHLDDQQREIYLREQLRVIQSELYGEETVPPEPTEDDQDLLSRIQKASLPDAIREKLTSQAKKVRQMPFGSSEAALLNNYIETCLEIPWQTVTEDCIDPEKAKKILDRDHDGLEKVKERILEFLSASALRGRVQGQILCLVGAPGVGKTSIASSIAEALGRKYVRISLGGVRDEADIRGHRKTYIGAMPGRIITALCQAGSMNPLITLDEIDKLTRDSHGDPSSALLEVLDSAQNHAFRDHFVELPVDLSSCVFLATANDTATIPPALLDRMELIHINGYTESEKCAIAKNHLIPKQLKEHGLESRHLRISVGALRRIIRSYTREQGVRKLEREIARICRKSAKKVLEGAEKVSVTEKNLTEFLGKEKILPEKKNLPPRIGVVNGLAWTMSGGEMLEVEALCLSGSGKLELTGSLGDVMKESAKAAISLIRSDPEGFAVRDPEFYKNSDLHVHLPEGAIPKDGPSAGVTLVTCLASLLSGIPVRGDVAMTGEITLHGKVLPIGGLREKAGAALRAGIRTVLFPADNQKDLEDVDPKALAEMEFVPCHSIEDVLRVALVKE